MPLCAVKKTRMNRKRTLSPDDALVPKACRLSIVLAFCASADSTLAQQNASQFLDELRGGVLHHDINSTLKSRHEKGPDLNLEFLFKSPSLFDRIWSPSPHLGISQNTRGSTSQYYFGLTWTIPFLEHFFIDLSFGGSINNAHQKRQTASKLALGSNLLFREAVSLGVLFRRRHTLSVMLDHTSSAASASPNPGLTNLGLRYGFKF